jgi:hypothetical protein
MSQSVGPYTDRYGLVFGYDMSETANSYKGEPTVNVSYNNGQGGSEYLGSTISWVNAGSWTYNDNETDVPKPSVPGIDITNLRIISGVNTTAGGSVHFGCGYSPISPSTTYTVSVWYRQNRAGASQPYMRTNITNAGLANLAYNGNTDSNTWPVNQWIRISASGTTASNENGIYISNYIGTYIGDKIWYFGHQVEPKDHMTPLVLGTRSATQSILDVTGNGTIDVTNATFNSSGSPIFDGTNDYMSVASYAGIQIIDSITVETVVKFETSNLGSLKVFGMKYHSTGWELILGANGNMAVGGRNGDGTYYSCDTGRLVVDGRYHHIVFTKSGLDWKVYVDGTLSGSITLGTVGTLSNSGEIQLGKEGGSYHTAMTMDVFKIYNRVHVDSEVQINFQRYRRRYSIPYYYEGSNASLSYFISKWNNSTTYNMAQFGGLGNVTAHGFTSGPVTFTLTLPISHAHTQVRYKVFWHLVDSLDNETNQLFITNQTGNEVELLRFTKQYNLVPNISIQKVGVTATWSGHQTYTYRPWGGGTYGQDGYLTVDSGWTPHTGNTLTVRHVMGADQGQTDEAEYLSHVEVDIL